MSSVKINQETVNCNPSEQQTEFDDPESDKLFIGVSLSLTLETVLPRILSSVRVATYLPENGQEEPCNVSSIGSKTRHSTVLPQELSRKWRVGINTARQTFKATTQRGIRATVHPPTRPCQTDSFSLRHRAVSTLSFAPTQHLQQPSCSRATSAPQVFAAWDFISVHPMVSKQERAQALQVFAEDIGIPADLRADGAAELTGPNSEWRKLC